mgnify:CR=1 FL=1
MEFDNLEREIDRTNKALAKRIRELAPVDTGALRRSIKPGRVVETPQGIEAPISLLGYYIFPDLGTKFQRSQQFIERAQNQIIGEDIQDIANAAAEDVAAELEKTLPDTLQLTIPI